MKSIPALKINTLCDIAYSIPYLVPTECQESIFSSSNQPAQKYDSVLCMGPTLQILEEDITLRSNDCTVVYTEVLCLHCWLHSSRFHHHLHINKVISQALQRGRRAINLILSMITGLSVAVVQWVNKGSRGGGSCLAPELVTVKVFQKLHKDDVRHTTCEEVFKLLSSLPKML